MNHSMCIQTAEQVLALSIRENADSPRNLLDTDRGGGIRMFGE